MYRVLLHYFTYLLIKCVSMSFIYGVYITTGRSKSVCCNSIMMRHDGTLRYHLMISLIRQVFLK
jgi:hypothetical protein